MPFWRKNVVPPLVYEDHPWSGHRAPARQLEHLLKYQEVITQHELLQLPPDVAVELSGFIEAIKQATQNKDRRAVMSAFMRAHAEATSRKQANFLAFMNSEQHASAIGDQKATFEREVRATFGKEAVTLETNEGPMLGVSTRTGGLRWAFGQGWRVLINPQQVKTDVSHTSKGSKTSVSSFAFKPDADLFDDYAIITWKGLGISNSSSGTDFQWIEWPETNGLAINTNATFLADPINRWILPLNKKTALKQWVPSGTFKVTDRQSGKTLVTVLMPWPQQFQHKFEDLRRKMLPISVPTIKPVGKQGKAPIEVTDYIGALPGSLAEEIFDLLLGDGREGWRRFKHFMPKDGLTWKTKPTLADWKKHPRITQLFVFKGTKFADEQQMAKSLEEALADIKTRYPELQEKVEKLNALKAIALKMRPHVDKVVQQVIDKIVRTELKK